MTYLALSPLVALGAVCAMAFGRSPLPPTYVPAASPPALVAFSPPVITRLLTHDHVLSIRAGTDAPRFDVADRDGSAVAAGLADVDLRARFPALYDLVDPLRGARADAYLDATLDDAITRGADARR